EPRALGQLLQLCRRDVRSYAQRNCFFSDVEDAVQETLLILVRKIHTLRDLPAFSHWLFKIVQRQCRRLGLPFGFDPYEESKVELWLGSRSDDAMCMDLGHAFGALPAHYREIIWLRDFEGLSLQEIAARTGLTSGAAKSRLHRARELTRELLLA